MADAEFSEVKNAFERLSIEKDSLSIIWIYGPPDTNPELAAETYLKAWAAVIWGRSTMIDSSALLFYHPIGQDLVSDGYWYKSAPSAKSLRLAVCRQRALDGAPRIILITDSRPPNPEQYPAEYYDMIEEIDLGQKTESDSEISMSEPELA